MANNYINLPAESGGGGGVTSLNSLTGALTLAAGSGITITPSGGNTLTIASTDVGGTVTSVGMSVPNILSVAGSPITTAGTLAVTLATQSANTVFSGPTSGSAATPTFRALVSADLPANNTILAKSASYTITSTDINNKTIIYADSSGGAFNLTLPAASTFSGKIIQVLDSTGSFGTNAVTMIPNGADKIQGLNANLPLSANWGSYTFQSNGTDWFKIGQASNKARKVFSSSGSWVAPAGITQVDVSVRGGSAGGAGGASGAISGNGGGGGGCGGSAVSKIFNSIAVTPGAATTVTVGAAGAAGTGGSGDAQPGTQGTSGGTSSFGTAAVCSGGLIAQSATIQAGGYDNPFSYYAYSLSISGIGFPGGAGGAGGSFGGNGSPGMTYQDFSTNVTGVATPVPYFIEGTGGAGGLGNTLAGGGGGGPASFGDGNGANGGAGGAGGAVTGLPGVAGSAGTNGSGGGGGGGGGSGAVASGAGANGGAGSTGQVIVMWSE